MEKNLEMTVLPRARASAGGRQPVRIVLAVWALAALAFAASGAISSLPVFVVPGSIAGGVAVALIALRLSPAARAYLALADLRPALWFQAVRAPIGLAFLWFGARGELHPSFAELAGWGDLLAGCLALSAGWQLTRASRDRARPMLWWFNVVGLLDILAVIVTAQRILIFGGGLQDMRAMIYFPFPAVPTFVVPLVLLTHLWIFARLRRGTELARSGEE